MIINLDNNGIITIDGNKVYGGVEISSGDIYSIVRDHINFANDAFLTIDMYCKGIENSAKSPYINYETFLNILIAVGIR